VEANEQENRGGRPARAGTRASHTQACVIDICQLRSAAPHLPAAGHCRVGPQLSHCSLLYVSTPRPVSRGPQTNLTWLDLSFNRISVIEGLEALTGLQDLSLFSNRISVLSGLDALMQLNALSIGDDWVHWSRWGGDGAVEEVEPRKPGLQQQVRPALAQLPLSRSMPPTQLDSWAVQLPQRGLSCAAPPTSTHSPYRCRCRCCCRCRLAPQATMPLLSLRLWATCAAFRGCR
jgi:hypothetical protein